MLTTLATESKEPRQKAQNSLNEIVSSVQTSNTVATKLSESTEAGLKTLKLLSYATFFGIFWSIALPVFVWFLRALRRNWYWTITALSVLPAAALWVHGQPAQAKSVYSWITAPFRDAKDPQDEADKTDRGPNGAGPARDRQPAAASEESDDAPARDRQQAAGSESDDAQKQKLLDIVARLAQMAGKDEEK